MTSFRSDTEGSVLLQHQDDLHVAVNNYDEVLRSLLNKHAPVKERVVTVRPSTPWYTAEVTAVTVCILPVMLYTICSN